MGERSVLISDDDPDIRAMLRDVLEDEGYVVYDGVACHALGLALVHMPDCILLDLMQPDLDGWTFRRALLTYRRTKDIPVILMTALGSASQWQGDLRCAGWLEKPFSIDAVLAAVAKAMADREARDDG